MWSNFATGFSPTRTDREGPLMLSWPNHGKLVVHGGRIKTGPRIKTVLSDVQVLDTSLSGGANQWKTVHPGISSSLCERCQHAGVLYESGNMVIHGGKSRKGTVLNATAMFNFQSASWESFDRWAGGCKAPAMFGHSMTPLPEPSIVVYGPMPAGKNAARQPVASRKEVMCMYVLNLRSDERGWRQVDQPLVSMSPRRGFGMCVTSDGTSLVLSGGSYNGVFLNETWIYSMQPGLWRQLDIGGGAPLSAAPRVCVISEVKEEIYVLGDGFALSEQRPFPRCTSHSAIGKSKFFGLSGSDHTFRIAAITSYGGVWLMDSGVLTATTTEY